MDAPFDYTYDCIFIAGKLSEGRITRTDYKEGNKLSLQVSIQDKSLGEHLASNKIDEIIADLTDLAVAVSIADRFSKRHDNRTICLQIKLPMRSLIWFEKPSLSHDLRDLLYWFTEDLWDFQFTSYKHNGRLAEQKPALWDWGRDASARVMLWSGGLDALAGLYHQLTQESDTRYTLVGTGSNKTILGKQDRLHKKLRETLEDKNRLKLVQLLISLKKGDARTVSSARARGFVFLLLGAVCALQEKQQELFVYENGIGAINLPFRDCEVGLDHTRSVHPLTLARMSLFLEGILEHPFSFKNPFLFFTKATMCQRILQEYPEIACETISCDGWYRDITPQCGYCSSCLLRRQAIAAYGVKDQTLYQIPDNKQREAKKFDNTHLVAMLAQIETLQTIQRSGDPWQALAKKYPILSEVVEITSNDSFEDQETIRQKILHLYRTYVSEWEQEPVQATLLQGLLKT